MFVFALIYSVGVSTGYEELVGIFSSMKKLEEHKAIDMTECNREARNYEVKPIVVDKIIRETLSEW